MNHKERLSALESELTDLEIKIEKIERIKIDKKMDEIERVLDNILQCTTMLPVAERTQRNRNEPITLEVFLARKYQEIRSILES
mgnify:CR=1